MKAALDFTTKPIRLYTCCMLMVRVVNGLVSYQTQALITALHLGRTTLLGSMYDSTGLVDNP